jgi:predicted ATPase/transcriptional regulator with XRE-family HTH domain
MPSRDTSLVAGNTGEGNDLVNESANITRATFGDLLKRLRKRAGMTQDDLAAATGYSRSLIGALERNDRLPDIEVVIQTYLPTLGLQEEPLLAAQLVEAAAMARGERPPSSFALKRERHPVITQEGEEEVHCFPVPPTEILGRDEEISHLCNRLLGHHGRLLTLVGPPGVGKTRLAQAVGAQLQTFYRNGACFIPLAAISNPALAASALASALRLPGSSVRPPQSRLIEHLRRKEMLLVLDNFEQLIGGPSAAVELVAELLAECPGLCILVTSRERLHLRAEQRYHVQPLALAAAVDLFVERCIAVDAEFTLTAANRPTVEAICQQVDRLPLALELCAAQIDLLSLPQLLAGLQDRRLELLVDGAHDLPPRQRTLYNAITYSYDLLDEGERRIFRSLGVFVGGCTLEAIEAVSGWGQEMTGRPLLTTLHALIGKSLVRTETTLDGTGRYLLLETIREFALEQARADGEEALLRRRHYAAYLQLFRTGDAQLRGPEATAWLARLDPEQDNLRAALQWGLDGRRYADAAWLLLAAAWFWFHTGRWQESARWTAQLWSHRDTLDASLRLAVLINLYHVSRAWEDFQPIDRFADELTGLLEACPDKVMHAAAWLLVGTYGATLAAASAAWERGIACARAAYDHPRLGPEFGVVTDRDWALGATLWAYADILIEHGEFARAAPLLTESSELSQAQGNHYKWADGLSAAGRLALLQGDLPKAHALLHEAVTLGRALNYHRLLGESQSVLGLVTLYVGNVPEAHRLLEDSLRLCLDLNDGWFLGRVCTCLAETALWEGGLDEAEHWLAQALAYHAHPRLIKIDYIESLLVAARLATAQGAYLRAATLFGLAERIRSQTHYELAGPARLLTDAALTRVRAALDPALFDEAFTAGEQLSLEEAFATILAPSSATAGLFSMPQPSASSFATAAV